MTYHKSGNPSGVAKNRFCAGCTHHTAQIMCPGTRHVSEWVHDETGKSRTISGGICAKVEDYAGPAA